LHFPPHWYLIRKRSTVEHYGANYKS